MNRKQLILLLLALVIIGGACLVLLHRREESWSAPAAQTGDRLLPDFDPNNVAAVRIVADTELHLAREGDAWRVRERNDYPANFGQLSELLLKLRDLKIVEAYAAGPSDLARVQLQTPGTGPNAGTLVEFMDARGRIMASLLLGKKHLRESSSPLVNGSADGRYVLLSKKPDEVFLVPDALEAFHPKPQVWLSKNFIKVEHVKSIALDAGSNSWKAVRENESLPWTLADARPGEVLDTNKVTQAAKSLMYAVFADVAMNTNAAQTGLDHPRALNVATFENFDYTLKVGNKMPDGTYPVTVTVNAAIPTARTPGKDETPDDAAKLREKLAREQSLAPWVYLMNGWAVETFLRERGQIAPAVAPAQAKNE